MGISEFLTEEEQERLNDLADGGNGEKHNGHDPREETTSPLDDLVEKKPVAFPEIKRGEYRAGDSHESRQETVRQQSLHQQYTSL